MAKWIPKGITTFIYADENHISRKSDDPIRYLHHIQCSNCGMVTSVLGSVKKHIKYDFCPHCGTMMKEVRGNALQNKLISVPDT